MKERRIKGLNLRQDWSAVQQNPRITIKETGIGFYYFYQMILKKQNGKTQDPPLVRGKQAKAFRVSVPQPGPASVLPSCFHSPGVGCEAAALPHSQHWFPLVATGIGGTSETPRKLPHFQRWIVRSPIRISKEADC